MHWFLILKVWPNRGANTVTSQVELTYRLAFGDQTKVEKCQNIWQVLHILVNDIWPLIGNMHPQILLPHSCEKNPSHHKLTQVHATPTESYVFSLRQHASDCGHSFTWPGLTHSCYVNLTSHNMHTAWQLHWQKHGLKTGKFDPGKPTAKNIFPRIDNNLPCNWSNKGLCHIQNWDEACRSWRYNSFHCTSHTPEKQWTPPNVFEPHFVYHLLITTQDYVAPHNCVVTTYSNWGNVWWPFLVQTILLNTCYSNQS